MSHVLFILVVLDVYLITTRYAHVRDDIVVALIWNLFFELFYPIVKPISLSEPMKITLSSRCYILGGGGVVQYVEFLINFISWL